MPWTKAPTPTSLSKNSPSSAKPVWAQATRLGAWAAVCIGLGVYAWACLVKPDLGGWHAVTPAILASIAVFILVSLAGHREKNLDFFP